jgi:hypothetical protein
MVSLRMYSHSISWTRFRSFVETSTRDLKSCKIHSFMRIQVEISFYNQMDNMSKDKIKHYYLLTTAFLMSGMSSSSLNIWNATWNPHKKDPYGCWAHCIKVPKWQVNAVPNSWEGYNKIIGFTTRFVLCLSVAFGFFHFFRHSVLCMFTKGPAWSAIPIRNTKILNFCEQNL